MNAPCPQETPAYRPRSRPRAGQAGICCVIRPPHPLGGVAGSRSLFVATPPLILPRVNHGLGLLRRTSN